MRTFDPHPVQWTPEKVSTYWDYVSRTTRGEFFSDRHCQDLAGRLITAAHPSKLIDIGCGTGSLVGELVRRGVTCFGVDSSPRALDDARGRSPTSQFFLSSIVDLPLPDASIDAATMIEVIEHLDDETLRLALSEAHRVLREGGTLMLTTPNSEDLLQSSVRCPDCGAEFHTIQHVRSWTAQTLSSTLARHGFQPSVKALRFVENGRRTERLLRAAYYRATSQRPRLLAFGVRVG